MRMILSFLIAFVLSSSMAISQISIEKFEHVKPDTMLTRAIEGNKSSLTLTQNTSDKVV